MQLSPILLAEAGGVLLPLADASVRTGFPSPAADFGETRIDLTAELITHPQATYLLRVRGISMVARLAPARQHAHGA